MVVIIIINALLYFFNYSMIMNIIYEGGVPL